MGDETVALFLKRWGTLVNPRSKRLVGSPKSSNEWPHHKVGTCTDGP